MNVASRSFVLSVAAAGAIGHSATALAAQETETAADGAAIAERCSGPEYRAFDFWMGSWVVSDSAGQLLGHNEVTRVSDGCALLEDWRGAGGGRGVSINTYDADRDRWTQRWVGAGATLWLEGGLENGAMVLASTAPRSTPRGAVHDRITWTPLPDGRVRQAWDISSDGGETWMRSFVGLYARSASSSPAAKDVLDEHDRQL